MFYGALGYASSAVFFVSFGKERGECLVQGFFDLGTVDYGDCGCTKCCCSFALWVICLRGENCGVMARVLVVGRVYILTYNSSSTQEGRSGVTTLCRNGEGVWV